MAAETEMPPFIKSRLSRSQGALQIKRVLIPSTEQVAEAICNLPPGTSAGLAAVRDQLARDHDADTTCPVTTQRALETIAADVVDALASKGQEQTLVPFWRAVDPARPGARRLAGGTEFIRSRIADERKREGHGNRADDQEPENVPITLVDARVEEKQLR